MLIPFFVVFLGDKKEREKQKTDINNQIIRQMTNKFLDNKPWRYFFWTHSTLATHLNFGKFMWRTFYYYGAIALQATANSSTVTQHIQGLLRSSEENEVISSGNIWDNLPLVEKDLDAIDFRHTQLFMLKIATLPGVNILPEKKHNK